MLCHHHICLVHLPKRKPVPTGQLLPILSHPPPRGKLLGNKRWGATLSGGFCLDVWCLSAQRPLSWGLALLHALSPNPELTPPSEGGRDKYRSPAPGSALLSRASQAFLSEELPGLCDYGGRDGGKLPQVQEH